MTPIHLSLVVAAGCLSNATPRAAAATPPDTASTTGQWVTLFDGGATNQWRGFRRDHFPTDGWRVDSDALTPLTDSTVIDLITRRQYRDYELELEWRVAPRDNNGLFVHVTEDHPQVWHTGPEIQLLECQRQPAQSPRLVPQH